MSTPACGRRNLTACFSQLAPALPCSDLVVALTASSAATSLAVVVLDDQAVIDRIAWAERQRALPSAQAAGAVAAALAERDRLDTDGQLQVGAAAVAPFDKAEQRDVCSIAYLLGV